MNGQSKMYETNQVVEIAGLYGTLLSAVATISVAGTSGNKQEFNKAHGDLERALKQFKEKVPPSLQNLIMQTQGPELSVEVLEHLLAECRP